MFMKYLLIIVVLYNNDLARQASNGEVVEQMSWVLLEKGTHARSTHLSVKPEMDIAVNHVQ